MTSFHATFTYKSPWPTLERSGLFLANQSAFTTEGDIDNLF